MSERVFNLQYLFPAGDSALQTRFGSAQPFPHAVLPNALDANFSCRLFNRLESFPYRWRRVTESFYEHEVCNLLQLSTLIREELEELVQSLQDPSLIQRLCAFVGCRTAHLMALTGHRLYASDRIDTHNDDTSKGELFRLLMFIDPQPRFHGGELLLQEKVAGEAITRATVGYVPFQAFLFRFGQRCYHAVSPVESADEKAYRLTVLATYGNSTH